MKLHARNIAVSAGATGKMVDIVAEKMVEEKKVRFDRAKELVEQLRESRRMPRCWTLATFLYFENEGIIVFVSCR